MAANSSGVEWGSIVKPILAASYGSFNKNDITELAKAIIRSESELVTHDEKYETFYTAFSALAADYISSSASSVCKSQLGVVCSASRILLRYLLSRLSSQGGNPDQSSPNTLPTKQLLLPIKALCSATSMLSRSDQIALTAIMKNAKLPPHIKTSMPGDCLSGEVKEVKEGKVRSRADLSNQIMEQLTSPLLDYSVPRNGPVETPEGKPSDSSSDKSLEIENAFIHRNIASLKSLGAADVMIEMCLQLPHLARYFHKYNTAIFKKGFSLPSTFSEAQLIRHSLQAVVGDMSIVWSALSLPVLEPLSSARLEKLTAITMTCLYSALSAATAASVYGVSSTVSPKTVPTSSSSGGGQVGKPGEDESNADTLATTVVEKALEIFNLTSFIISSSTRTGGNVLQNHTLIGAWLLISGLQAQLSASSQVPSDKPGKEDKGKSPSKCREGSARINLMKVQQGFGVLSVALASRALTLMGELLEDAQFEAMGNVTAVEHAELNILAHSTALQRAVTILNAAPINQFLFYLATVSYRKACTLKRIQKHPPEGDTFSTSDSTTYYDDDDMSCSDESSPDVDDDSEPLLGLWFEETISVPDCDNSANTQSQETQDTPAKPTTIPSSSVVPDKGEPNGFISLASQIFHVMNKYLVTSESTYLMRFVETGLSEQQMVMLAAIIRDLDRETARTDTGTISVYFGQTLGQLYSEFSHALNQYTHNLLARNLLSESLQSTLLLHLGVNPFTNSTDSIIWPLQVYPRTLAVLAQVLLLKPQTEKETACISIWQRLINTLVDNIRLNQTTVDVENEDLNVEHAQLVLFLFHSLNLMQKKSVLLLCASAVVLVAEHALAPMRESQLLHLSRLLLLLDYLVKHLYDAPAALLEQVQWNLLSGTNLINEGSEGNVATRVFCPCNEIEDNYRKLMPHDEFSMRPRFYSLTYGEFNNQEPPKLDGLACNFILGTVQYEVKYPELMDALVDILNVTDQCSTAIKLNENISYTSLCAVQYCFMICWRLLLQLPPSTPYLEKLAQGDKIGASPLLLHSLIWGPRTAHKTFIPWLKDCLVKQGMYTQYTELALKNVADVVNNLSYDINLGMNCIASLTPQIDTAGWLVAKQDLPTLMELCILDAVVAKIQALTDHSNKASTSESEANKTIQTIDTKPSNDLIQELLPHLLRLAEVIVICSRASLMYQISEEESGSNYTDGDLSAFCSILAISSTRGAKTQALANAITQLLPTPVTAALEKWNSNAVTNFPSNEFANDIIPGESCVMSVVIMHISSLSGHNNFTINPSLKHLLHSLVTFISEHISKCSEGDIVWQQAVKVLAPLTLDACTDYLHDTALHTLEKAIGDPESDKHQATIYALVLQQIYTLIMNYTGATSPCSDAVNEKILHECLSWMESLIEKAPGRQALDKFFDDSPERDLVQILLSVASPRTSKSTAYGTRVLQFFNKLLSIAEKTPGDEGLERLCASVLRLANVDSTQLSNWLHHVILGPGSRVESSSSLSNGLLTTSANDSKTEKVTNDSTTVTTNSSLKEKKTLFQENQLLLQYLTAYIVKQNSGSEVKEAVAVTLLEALVPMASELLTSCQGAGFPQLMIVMSTLADAGSGKGHVTLFIAATWWISICKDKLCEKEILVDLESGGGITTLVESACYLLNYVGDVVRALCPPSPARATSPPWEGEPLLPPDPETDWMEDLTHDDDDESGGDESDEDSLCNKLCTFTITQKEFMNQHWYHCHTCKMVDGVGVCSVCARVCHRGHDVTYAKFGNFFCDCGARENGACQALMKRSPQSNTDAGQPGSTSNTGAVSGMEHMLTSSLRRRPSSPSLDRSQQQRDQAKQAALSKLLEPLMEPLVSLVNKEASLVAPLVTLVKALLPAVEASCQRNSPVGCHQRSQSALKQLHIADKRFMSTDQLMVMVPTLGSQEGAFENVRMNYSGEQGQTIRQLMSAHMIRRVAMCCLASPYGKRQHLAVSHEKGKITVLQLSALLKQADSSKRKLTLTRLSSAPIPFTVLSITGNQLNEDFLAVCGLKDCHVLTFTSGGSVADHLVLHPQLETGNFIIRAVWLPGSQTKLALVTADFVKIYDLSHDVLSPQYYFLVPTGKIRDVTFACSEEGKANMLLMSSTGYVYIQDMNEQSSAKHGPFYVTNTLEMYHPEIKESNGQVCGGGVSIYYSHTLRLLFYSYVQGKSFIAPLECGQSSVSPVFQINLGRTSGNNSGGSNKGGSGSANQPQPLCQWSEVPNHPGLICSVLQTSNNPVILMIKPDSILVQEIKVVPAKAKIMDMVAIRHPSSNSEHRTTLILLCEDGSLRIYMASMDQTGFWLSPSVQAASTVPPHKSSKKKKTTKIGKPSGTVAFPVDFFEHCTLMDDVEFGGNDLLQIYNAQQIKHRLNTTGMYIVSTRAAGFQVEIINNDTTHVITGIRVLVGNQDTQRVPGYIEVGGRSISTTVTRNRWFDFPLTREESLQADKKLTVTFGPSLDADAITMVDSIKVYGKTKDVFGWPEETEEVPSSSGNTTQTATTTNVDSENSSQHQPVTSLDKMISGILEVLDGCFTLTGSSFDDKNQLRPSAITLATALLTLPTASCIQLQTKSLLAALHLTRQQYHVYKDQSVLSYVLNSLGGLRQVTDSHDLDTEAFYRLVLMTRAIAVARPVNLVKYSQPPESSSEHGQKNHLILQFIDILWRLHSAQPKNISLASVCIPGLRHVEATVYSLVEIVHAFTVAEHNETMTTLAARIYLDLLLCQDTAVSFSAKHAIIRVLRPRIKRRRVFIPSPPHCSTPGAVECEKPGPVSQPSQDSSEAEPNHFDESVEPVVLLAPDPGAVGSGVSVNVEALLSGVGGGAGFPPMLDIPPDADDETMVELAIALSLQDHEGAPNLHSLVNLQALQNLAGPALQALAGGQVPVGGGQSQEAGHYSDTTASAGGSDDEGSTAATDGSTLRTSPADQGGSGGSESGGSGVDSITGEHNVSGRSSAYGDNMQEALAGARSETSSLGVPAGFQNQEPDGLEAEVDNEPEGGKTLHALRLATLERLVQHVPQLQNIGGVTAIPFMQVVLMLTSDLDGEEERGRACLEALLNAVLSLLAMNNPDILEIKNRNPHREVQLVIMRLLSVLMSRPKSTSKSDNTNFVSQTTANMLIQSGIIDYCLTLLKELITYWKSCAQEESNTAVGGTLLKPHLPSSPPDMSPFFLRQYVKGHATDVFEAYPHLLTEMALRLPYQVQKHTPSHITFSQPWFYYLCEYMMTQQTPFVRRQVRKLLLFICGNKEKYRQLRDLHSLESHMKAVKYCLEGNGVRLPLSYDALVELTEHLKACVEVGTSRTSNWRQFCLKDNTVLAFLMQASCVLEEAVAQITLQLLQCAICPVKQASSPSQPSQQESKGSSNSRGGSKERVEESETEDAHCLALVRQLNSRVPRDLLTRFMRAFLLETNASNMRWQAHALILSIYKNSELNEQEIILDQLWYLWPQLPSYGRKAAQFVDLLGYFSIKSTMSPAKMTEYIEQAIYMLKTQNQVLSLHPNATLYNQLAQYVELEGYYLESDPCLVCNNPELPLTNIKLSSIKIDSKFTTTTQIVKLVSSHMISKITLRITDPLKRTKMVRTMNIYYNNRSVQAVVELKNKPSMWYKAKKVTLASGQTEVKIEFPLPIVACNLMIEYADFYENLQASSETLQCPRCSSSVPAHPGVCANCGENVFQCHKCRAINYDEKDPFLCHACGFCKYAKFDFTLTGRQCCAVDPIENDEDRKKTIAAINSHLEKADRVYKQLIGNKPTLEMLLLKISEHRSDRGIDEVSVQTGGNSSGSNNSVVSTVMVNRGIQLLAQRYCTDCKTSFEELSRTIQKVLACRRKLVAYDRSQLEQSGQIGMTSSLANIDLSEGAPQAPYQGKCYGCASSATEHCLILLRALASNVATRQILCNHGLVQELVENNLRRGTTQVQEDVRQLICLVTGDNMKATQEMCSMLMERIALTLRGHVSNSELAAAVRPEMNLLAALVHKEDTCWELKLRCVMQLFLMACSGGKSPVVMESITLPCLKILQGLIKPDQPNSKKNKDKTLDSISTIRPTNGIRVNVQKWLRGDMKESFKAWRKHMPSRHVDTSAPSKPQSKSEARTYYLQEKYARKWREKLLQPLKLTDSAWLKQVLFNPSSRLARQVTCNMLESLCQEPTRKREMLDLLTGFLSELGTAGESAAEYLSLYQSLVQQSPWKQYLALKGVLIHLADLLTVEIDAIHKLEGSTLTSDLSQGYALKMLTELMASFLEQPSIKQQYKGRLVGAVLNGYLSLRRLVVQRTRLIDETQDKLLELLEEMTTGTEAETKAFMAICIQTVEKCPPQDVRTPVFVFERLCSIIFPEENDVGEFYLTLEKDPQQEDFLQGRMLGNPYSCNEPGLGPLMRDVKNKICQDCELVALLEDDNGMELLVNNKIISLDLPVKEVYKKIWVAEGGEGDSMKVVYRMRGLLGDATEEFVETLHAKTQQEVNYEEVYKMANVMAECGGLQVILARLSQTRDTMRSRPLLQVILKLLLLCVKVSKNKEVLCQSELGAVTILLNTLELCVSATTQQTTQLIEQILEITESILSMAAAKTPEEYMEFSQGLGGVEHIKSLLECAVACPSVRSTPAVLRHLTRVLAALTYGNQQKMAALMDYFRPYPLDFNKFDAEHTPDDEQKLELFCNLAVGIEKSPLGNTLKDYTLSLGIVEQALGYITSYAPFQKPTFLHSDSDEWKEFISKPSLKYILRFLTGLSSHHKPTQDIVSVDCITIIHRLEQVSSDEHVGSLAENLLEALRTNECVASRIEEVREKTRAEKKRLAMAMREKQLGALGMRTNDKGQLTVDSTIMQQMEDLGEETGLVCVICREGYKFQPSKVLGVYTFTKRCNVEEFENKSRKTVGYSTVTHFNVVHIDCHMSAVRLARVRDEWESAALQNANTKCNGLLPLWGPQVPESAFASCLARHNTYLQESTGHRDISYSSTVHDLKLLLLRFAQEKSFHEDAGGGGPQSNMHIIPYLMHMALYVINTTRCGSREAKNLNNFLDFGTERRMESYYEAEGAYYWATFSLLLHSPGLWAENRLEHLKRLIILAHLRHLHPASPPHHLSDLKLRPYPVYKSTLIFFALIDAIYNNHFKKVPFTSEDHWPANLADYIRHNDEALMKASERLMAIYNDELLPCTSFEEFCDVAGLLGEIPYPPTFISETLTSASL